MKIEAKPQLAIKAERVRKGLTQTDMAKRLNISATSYNLKERGVRDFTLKEFRLLLENLECDPGQLL